MSQSFSSPVVTTSMRLACVEGRHWMGATSPNPPVGALALDERGQIIGLAAHQRAGELHAEAALIEECRARNRLSEIHTLCVTLEPCNHLGRTPPCTDTIIQAGIKRIIIGTRDPNPYVKGGGLEALRQAGIEVEIGVNEEECKQLIHAYTHYVDTGKPWVTIKRAFGQDGSMMPPAGHKTFTSENSLRLSHRLRKKTDAIITGSGTVLADDPLFTVRHVNDYPGKRRILAILDRRKRVPESYLAAARSRGLDAFICQDISEAVADLTQKGAQDILVEAGPALSQSVLDSQLWTMSVNIQKADRDAVAVEFNRSAFVPFDIEKFSLDNLLPP